VPRPSCCSSFLLSSGASASPGAVFAIAGHQQSSCSLHPSSIVCPVLPIGDLCLSGTDGTHLWCMGDRRAGVAQGQFSTGLSSHGWTFLSDRPNNPGLTSSLHRSRSSCLSLLASLEQSFATSRYGIRTSCSGRPAQLAL
jgi:hypothetical protein